jgi:hypothetical protein
MSRRIPEYAVYRGEEFMCVGTLKECAESMGVKPDTIRYYLRPAYQNKIAKRKRSSGNVITVIRLDEDDDECVECGS